VHNGGVVFTHHFGPDHLDKYQFFDVLSIYTYQDNELKNRGGFNESGMARTVERGQ
jgi:hypothetical protein